MSWIVFGKSLPSTYKALVPLPSAQNNNNKTLTDVIKEKYKHLRN
jgi:hypothetical protein